MYFLANPVSSKKMAEALGLRHFGVTKDIEAVSPVQKASSGSLCFATNTKEYTPPVGAVLIAESSEKSGYIPDSEEGRLTLLESDHPRLDFIQALKWLEEEGFITKENASNLDPSASVHPTAVIEVGVQIGAYCHVGAYSHIHTNTIISNGVKIGSGCVLGHDGFGYERDKDGMPIHFPHLGKVVIGKGVVIGNNCCISRGSLNDTVISDHAILDDHVYVAHNAFLGKKTLVMSGVRINGSATIGEECWLGTGALIREGCHIDDRATVGMGAVVVKSVPRSTIVAGNPAKELE